MNGRKIIIIVSVLILCILCLTVTACEEKKGIEVSELRSDDVGVAAATSEKIDELEGYGIYKYFEGQDLVIFSKTEDSTDGRVTEYAV